MTRTIDRITIETTRGRRDISLDGELVFSIRFNRQAGAWILFDAEGIPLRYSPRLAKALVWTLKKVKELATASPVVNR